ncbi:MULTISPECIES: Shedu immune nuclease family protein [unclassified Mammaliicoccus]|uniref:Shedu immune nuclease family protein n=1 Tax=unclassified Mammaliicoccus TaxID=2803851 RepID=UPI001EFBA975|nr:MULTISPECIES: Shedu immune nuclease family protein [unclassified Mammaliicoccus]
MSKTLLFEKTNDMLLAVYYTYDYPEFESILFKQLETNGSYRLKNTFCITYDSIVDCDDEECVCFKIGSLDNGYYKLDSEMFNLENNFYFDESFNFKKDHFIAYRNISILKKIDNIINEDFKVISKKYEKEYDNLTAISDFEYKELIKNFPKTTELDKYSNYKISQIISEVFNVKDDYIGIYEEFLNRKKRKLKEFDNKSNKNIKMLSDVLSEYEVDKYKLILNRLKYLLKNEQTLELDWQKEIVDILTLIFPKYINVFSEYEVIRDSDKRKRVDFVLLDNNNNIDIIEIKKAHGINILNNTKSRGNYPPSKNLSSALMQVEKYLYYINTESNKVIKKLKKSIKEREDKEVEIFIRSPKGIVILGRTNNFNQQQLEDYRLIKNAYKNVVDIYSYDELILTLENIIDKFEKNKHD